MQRQLKATKTYLKKDCYALLGNQNNRECNTLGKYSFDDEKLKKIRKDFNELRDRFSKPQIKEIRKNLYDIKNPKTFQRRCAQHKK